MKVKHKIKINEIQSYCDTKIKLNAEQLKHNILSLRKDNVSLANKIKMLEHDIKNKKFELDSTKNSVFCKFLFK